MSSIHISDAIPTRRGPLSNFRNLLSTSRKPHLAKFRQSSHPEIEIPANPMKTITERIFNRHTLAYSQANVAHPAGRDEACSYLGPQVNHIGKNRKAKKRPWPP